MKFGLNSRLAKWIEKRDKDRLTFDASFFANTATFGERLKRLRQAAGLQQQDIAYAAGTTQFRVSAWERRKNIPGEPELQAISELFCVDPSALLAGLPPSDD